MGRVFADRSISLDGFSAGLNVGVSDPMGDDGEELHAWQFRGGRRPQLLDHLLIDEGRGQVKPGIGSSAG